MEKITQSQPAETGTTDEVRAKPADASDEPSSPQRGAAMPAAITLPASVLLVDDNDTSRELLADRLSGHGYLCFQAEESFVALDLIENQTFDVVLIDAVIPGLEGLAILEILRRKYSLAELPVVIMASSDSRDDVVKALALGANDYLHKPLDFDLLFARVETQLSLKRATDEVRKLNRRLQVANERIGKLIGSAGEALRDIPGWAATIAAELAPIVGARAVSVWLAEGDELVCHGGESSSPPDPAELMIGSERGSLVRETDTIIPVIGMTGEIFGGLVAADKVMWDESEMGLIASFAHQLGGALQMEKMRIELADAHSRFRVRRQEMLDRGIELLQICRSCGRCLDSKAVNCDFDGVLLGESVELLPLRLLGRYRLIRALAQGGMGRLFEGRDEKLDRPVAIKVIRPEHANDLALRSRFVQEARVVAKIGHPGVISIFDSGELENGSLFVVMELLHGCDLGRLLRSNGRGHPAQVASLLRQAGDALIAAHRAGILHRDIKPENIFMIETADGFRVKLLDFGIAKQIGSNVRLTQTGSFVGTPAYMAPEQMSGKKVDVRSDVYSFAAVMYEALTGRRVTLALDVAHIFSDILHHSPPAVSGLVEGATKGLDALFEKALAKEPADRPLSVEEWMSAVLPLVENLSDPEAPASDGIRLHRRVGWPDGGISSAELTGPSAVPLITRPHK